MILLEENRTKYILFAIIFFLVLIGAVVVFQQITINNLKKDLSGKNEAALNSQKSTAINNPSTVQAVKKNLEDNIKEIKGVITSKNGNLLTIEAEVVDFSKLSGLTEDQLHQSADSFPKTRKNYEVSFSDKTQPPSLKPESLSVGTTIMIESDELIYKSNHINASKITVVADQAEVPPLGTSLEDQVRQTKFIGGIIKEVGDKYFVVGTTQIDLSQTKDSKDIEAGTAPIVAKYYKVLFDDKTQFTDKGPNELKVEDFVRAFSSNSVYSVSEFTATKIMGPLSI